MSPEDDEEDDIDKDGGRVEGSAGIERESALTKRRSCGIPPEAVDDQRGNIEGSN